MLLYYFLSLIESINGAYYMSFVIGIERVLLIS